jgi:hypothetical protein
LSKSVGIERSTAMTPISAVQPKDALAAEANPRSLAKKRTAKGLSHWGRYTYPALKSRRSSPSIRRIAQDYEKLADRSQ